jgi:hypothetical protein
MTKAVPPALKGTPFYCDAAGCDALARWRAWGRARCSDHPIEPGRADGGLPDGPAHPEAGRVRAPGASKAAAPGKAAAKPAGTRPAAGAGPGSLL